MLAYATSQVYAFHLRSNGENKNYIPPQQIPVDATVPDHEQYNLEPRTKSSNKGKNGEPKQIKSFFAKLFS